MTAVASVVITAVSLVMAALSAYTLYLMIYTWNEPEAQRRAKAPRHFIAPQLSFSVILPARHEEAVIARTIEEVVRANYPTEMLQVLVVCSADDTGTIDQAMAKIEKLEQEGLGIANVVVFDDRPINKPHGLNAALEFSDRDVVTIFDAEDDIHPDIFNIVNTIMVEEQTRVIQAGVQLMNYRSRWYSTLNVLEYFFWFKSRLHYHAKYESIPLGGNTVFFSREVLLALAGWDESDLTEDADIGLRISEMGEHVRVVYDDQFVTREETPPTLAQFVRQRTRWDQGFIQTLRKGTWRHLATGPQRWLALYTLVSPYIQAALGLYVLVSLITMAVLHVPVVVALISYLPVLLLVAHFMLHVVGLYEFTEAHGLEATPGMVAKMALAWFPYQLVLAFAAMRAVSRQLRGVSNWEKTAHTGQLRRRQGEVSVHAA